MLDLLFTTMKIQGIRLIYISLRVKTKNPNQMIWIFLFSNVKNYLFFPLVIPSSTTNLIGSILISFATDS